VQVSRNLPKIVFSNNRQAGAMTTRKKNVLSGKHGKRRVMVNVSLSCPRGLIGMPSWQSWSQLTPDISQLSAHIF
jgi:hypothetical protein